MSPFFDVVSRLWICVMDHRFGMILNNGQCDKNVGFIDGEMDKNCVSSPIDSMITGILWINQWEYKL